MVLISKKMRAFMLVAKLHSISEAAKVLSLTVSPVSRLISDFEAACRKKLFVRHGNRILLNKDGMQLYNQLEELYTRLDDIEIEFKRGIKRNVDVIYHDWGKDYFILQYQKKYYTSKKYHDYDFVSINTLDGESLKNDVIYFLSSNVPTEHHEKILFKRADAFSLYFNEKFSLCDSMNTLFVFKDQLELPLLKANLDKIKKTHNLKKIVSLNSEMSCCEMVSHGHGVGLTMQSNLHTAVWSAHPFKHIKTDILLDFFVYVPKFIDPKPLKYILQEILERTDNDEYSTGEILRKTLPP